MTDAVKRQQEHGAHGEQGSAIVIALLIMALLSIFVVAALSRTATEATIMGNDSAEARSYAAAQASLETMSRNFNKIFETRLKVGDSDITKVQTTLPIGFSGYTFHQRLVPMYDRANDKGEKVAIKDGAFEGLNATQDPWLIDTTATDINGVQVRLRRTFKNNRIPIFQFGIFYNDDMELSPGARFDFGGRVHANGNMYLRGGGRVNFNSRVTAAGEIVTDVTRNGRANNAGGPANAGFGENVYIKDSVGVYQQLKIGYGSVLLGPDVRADDSDVADGSYNDSKWKSASTNDRVDVTPIDDIFDGNLIARTKRLEMPLRRGLDRKTNSYVELIKRGRRSEDNDFERVFYAGRYNAGDDDVVQASRYYYKPGIRVSLADSKSRLPGCATSAGTAVTGVCGMQLDRVESDGRIGYIPRAMTDGYQATRVNGYRMYRGTTYTVPNQPLATPATRQTWIKVELITVNPTTLAITTSDITAEILSLGVTERVPLAWKDLNNDPFEFAEGNYYDGNEATERTDNRSIVKLQRWVVPGAGVASPSGSRYHTTIRNNDAGINIGSCITEQDDITMNATGSAGVDSNSAEARMYDRKAKVNNENKWVVPFPIKMFDSREGMPNEYYNALSPYEVDAFQSRNFVSWNGVMSMIDIDVANLRRMMSGEFDTDFPSNTAYTAAVGQTFKSTAIPSESAADEAVKSLMLYVSDRRGDADFDGEFDMEDVYGPNDDILQNGEDVNDSSATDDPKNNDDPNNLRCDRLTAADTCSDDNKPAADYTWEGARYLNPSNQNAAQTTEPVMSVAAGSAFSTVNVDVATFFDHHFYRRAVRLVNGSQLPGNSTSGFTLSSENGVYIQGDYNATSIASVGEPTPAEDYRPDAASGQVPASVVADGVTILSNPGFLDGVTTRGWADGSSFNSPFLSGTYGAPYNIIGRPARETTIRTAIIMGDTIETLYVADQPHQGGLGSERSNGAVNNFKRFLENWGGDTRMNYCGSLINLFNSRNSSGTFKYGMGRIYNAPVRNWTFDTSFLDLDRLPPGTPFFQYLQLTGFQRVNEEVPLP